MVFEHTLKQWVSLDGNDHFNLILWECHTKVYLFTDLNVIQDVL